MVTVQQIALVWAGVFLILSGAKTAFAAFKKDDNNALLPLIAASFSITIGLSAIGISVLYILSSMLMLILGKY